VEWTFKRKLAAAAAGVAALAGAGGAYAGASGSQPSAPGDGHQALLNDVAKRLGVSPQKLQSAFEAAVADRRKQRGFPPGPPPGPGGPTGPGGPVGPGRPFGPGGPPGDPRGPGGPLMPAFAAAAKYLGLTDAQLRTQLRSGKSLADVAAARNKPLAGLKSAIGTALKSEIDSRLDEIVNAKPGARPPGPPFARRGFQQGPPFARRGFRRGPHW
jgi:hypothetical protein